METFLKDQLGYTFVKRSGRGGGGCISQGELFHTDQGKIYVKENHRPGALTMFQGEFASLVKIQETETVKVPRPVKVLEREPGAVLVMEYLELGSCSSQAELGRQVAALHLHNNNNNNTLQPVTSFGFDLPTCCGFLPQKNGWTDSWVKFYTEKVHSKNIILNRGFVIYIQLEEQIDLQNDTELHTLWPSLRAGLSSFFTNIEVSPSLLHGDLWSGNTGQVGNTPVVFDPASFYGHHEYDLAIGKMFGGFGGEFQQAYHTLIPKQEGFETRSELYQLFHYLNHWNHFGEAYRAKSLSLMKSLNKKIK